MNTRHLTAALLTAVSLVAHAATPEQEKAFVESYKKALESNDMKALAAFLYTDGAAKETVEFFTMMQTMPAINACGVTVGSTARGGTSILPKLNVIVMEGFALLVPAPRCVGLLFRFLLTERMAAT